MRQIFNDVSRSAGEAAEHVSFAELESTMYERRRRAQPQLPSSPSDADAIVRNSRYAELDGGTFYRGLVNADAHGSALIFASDTQLQQLKSATSVFFGATFKIVPHIYIYYQLFTIIVPHADYALPALYALMSRKTQSLNAAVFEKVSQLVPSFTPLYAMADFEEAPVATFKSVYVDANVAGCVDD